MKEDIISHKKLNLGNYFASGKNKIPTDCCGLGGLGSNRPNK